jgi:hypothetical protein
MKILHWKAYEKGTLQGFFELALDSGLSIRGMTYHSKGDGKRWVSFPSKPYEDNGETKYQALLHIPDDARWKKFQQMALAALDSHFAADRKDDPDDIPF